MKHFQGITAGIKELKINQWRRLSFLDDDLEPTAKRLLQDNKRALNLFSIANALGQTVFFICLGTIIFVCDRFLKPPPNVVTSFIVTITYLMLPFGGIIQRLPTIFRADVSLRKIEEMGLKLTENSENNLFNPDLKLAEIEKISMQGIAYTYPGQEGDRQFQVRDIDLQLAAGEIIFIVGGNGSGKSTLAKLIAGLYVPDTGKISLNGQTIDNSNREWYRQHFAVIFSDFYLFDRLLGISPTAADDRATMYLELLQIENKVSITSGVLSTTALSQGQRKRLALLAAYLDERPIYLFDEWAADQDPIFREIFYHQLLPQLRDRGKLIIAISHDERYFHLADRIVKLDYGRIANGG